MAGVSRLAVVDDATGTSFGASGIQAYTASGNYLVSVIVSNKGTLEGNFYVYVVPSGQINNPAAYGVIAYNLPLPDKNTYETFKFGINNTDSVYVAGSANFTYYVQGILQ